MQLLSLLILTIATGVSHGISPPSTSLRHGSVRISRFLRNDNILSGDVKGISTAALCSGGALCGLRYLNATDDQLYNVRLTNRYLEKPLHASGSLVPGELRVISTADLSRVLTPGAVLRVGNLLPLLVTGVGADYVELADAYTGSTRVEGDMFVLNMQVTPGLYDITQGNIIATPSLDDTQQPLDPFAAIPMSVLAAAKTRSLPAGQADAGSQSDASSVIGSIQPGDHIAFAGLVGSVIDTLASSSGGTSIATFSLQSPYPFEDAVRQRVYRFVGPNFPGLVNGAFDAKPGVDSASNGAVTSGAGDEEVDDLIAQLKGEATVLYDDKANSKGSSIHRYSAVPLPLSASVKHASTAVIAPVDITKYVLQGDVIIIGTHVAFQVESLTNNPDETVTLQLDAPYPGADQENVQLSLLPDFSRLPGAAQIITPTKWSLSGDLSMYLRTGTVVMLKSSSVVFGVARGTEYDATTQDHTLAMTPLGVVPASPVSDTGRFRVFATGYSAVLSNAGAICGVSVEHQSKAAHFCDCEPSVSLKPGQVIAVGHPDSWTFDRSKIAADDRPAWLTVAVVPSFSKDNGVIELAEPYAGASATCLPLFTTGAIKLPGRITVNRGSNLAATTFDARHFLQVGDMIRLSAFFEVHVTGAGLPAINVATSGVTAQVTDTSLFGIAADGFYLSEAYLDDTETFDSAYKLPLRQLPARVAFDAAGSGLFTSSDVTAWVAPGSCLKIALPQASLRLEIANDDNDANSERGTSDSVTSSHVKVVSGIQHGRTSGWPTHAEPQTLHRCPRMPVISRYAQLRYPSSIAQYLQSMELQCVQALDPHDSRVWYPLLLDGMCVQLRSNISAAISKRVEETARKQLPGTVSVIQGSAIVSTSVDLSEHVVAGDVLQVGSSGKQYVAAMRPSPDSFQLTTLYGEATATGVPLFVIYRRQKLSANIDVTHNSPTVKTRGDLREELAAGDLIEAVSKAQGRLVIREYNVLPPFSATDFMLSEAYSGVDEADCEAFRLIGGHAPGMLLPGTLSAQQGLERLETTEDLSGSIQTGDRLRVTTIDVIVGDTITPKYFTITAAYPGTTAVGLKGYNLHRTERQATLEQLARLKLQCRSIFCLAKIEELERAVPSDLTRSLNVRALLSDSRVIPTSPQDARDAVLSVEASAESAVEEEWLKWYERARQQVGIADSWSLQAAAANGAHKQATNKYVDAQL